MFAAYETEYERLLKSKLSTILESKVNSLVGGFAKDYAEYRERVGYLSALKDFGAVMQEIHDDLNKEEKD